MEITVSVTVNVPIEQAWKSWITPEDIRSWNFAADEWCCPRADIDLKVGGQFSYRMEAKDGSMGFDYDGTFTAIEDGKRLEFVLGDERQVIVEFSQTENGVKVIETFAADSEETAAQEKHGWQCILENFKKHVESKA